MKIAVCLSSQTRTFDYCVESILEFFNDCDLQYVFQLPFSMYRFKEGMKSERDYTF